MRLYSIATIAKTEIRRFLNTGSSYVMIIVFLFLWEFLFFRNAFVSGDASLRAMFDIAPWVLLLLVSAISMGTISKEQERGTLELLLTHPVSALEIIVAKWIASVGIVSMVLLFTLPIAFSFSMYGFFDWGVYASQILAAIFFAGALSAFGMYISSFVKTQIASLLITIVGGVLFIIIGTEVVSIVLPPEVSPVLDHLSLLSHMNTMARGVIDTRDVWYFLSVTMVFLGLTYLQFKKWHYGNRIGAYRQVQSGVILFTAIVILTNLLGERIPGRVDLSQSRIFSLASGTKKTLRELPDVVTVTVYASRQLPAQYASIQRTAKDILRDFDTVGGDKFQLLLRDPSANQEHAQEAEQQGIQPMQFNVVTAGELQIKSGYFGIAIDYAGETEVIPFLQDTSDLEYQLTGRIRKLTRDSTDTISFLTGHGEKSEFGYSIMKEILGQEFTLESGEEIATTASALIVAGPTEAYNEETLREIEFFIAEGNSVLWLADMKTPSPQTFSIGPATNNLNEILQSYGITANEDTIFDTQSNEIVNVGSGPLTQYAQYPYWIRSLPSAENNSSILTGIQYVTFPWASSISIDESSLEEQGYSYSPLLVTTPSGGAHTQVTTIAPGQVNLDQDERATQRVAVQLIPVEHSSKGRQIVIGDSDFLSDQFLRNAPGNVRFILQSVGWLVADEALSSIGIKQPVAGKMLFSSGLEVLLVQYGNMALALLVPGIYGFTRLLMRRRRSTVPYTG